jgi:hypothetical protein
MVISGRGSGKLFTKRSRVDIKIKHFHQSKETSSSQRAQFLADVRELFEEKPAELHAKDSNGEPLCDPLQWWASWDEGKPIWSLAQMFLSIPATSAPAERAFSSSGFIKSEHRNKLSSEHLEDCVTIRDFLRHSIDTQPDRYAASDSIFKSMFAKLHIDSHDDEADNDEDNYDV